MALGLRTRDRRASFTLAVLLHVVGVIVLFSARPELSHPPGSPAPPIDIFIRLPPEPPMPVDDLERPTTESNVAATVQPIDSMLEPGPAGATQAPLTERVHPTPPEAIIALSGSPNGSTARVGGIGSGVGAGNGAGDSRQGGTAGSPPSGEAPVWIRKPTEDQFFDALSFEAKQDRQDGFAILSCLVRPSGRVHACRILKERNSPTPVFGGSYEFGRAALRLSRHFLVRPPVRDEQPRYDIRVVIPVNWDFD